MAQFFDLRFDRLNFEASFFLGGGRFFTVVTTFGLSICGDDTVVVLVTPVGDEITLISKLSKSAKKRSLIRLAVMKEK